MRMRIMKLRYTTSALVVVALSLGGTGCSSDEPEPAPETVEASEAAAPVVEQEDVDEAARAYVDALASEDLRSMRRQQKAAADGSLAEAYMRHQANGNESDLDGGYPSGTPGEVTEGEGDLLRACYEADDDSETVCYGYGDFKVNDSGELANLTIDGKTLANRLTIGDGTRASTPLADFVFDSAYITQSGMLVVSGDIRTKGAPVFVEAGSNYRSPNGKVRAMSASSGLSNFPANSRSSFTAYFNGPIKFGGEMSLIFIEDGGTYAQATATVKIK